ncbi:MAG: putative toxin-antitoxin system toxin component, PIN family [Thermodesulfobacteriota bacterium]
MRKVVLDTNTIVSALLDPYGHPGKILDLAFKGKIFLISSERLLDELRRALHYGRVVKALAQHRGAWSEEDTADFITNFRKICRLSSSRPLNGRVCRDPDDDWLLACAEEAGADAIVSGDKDLLALPARQGVRILNAKAYLDLLIF